MYLHLGQGTVVRQKSILGIFDLDNTSSSYRTREFLERAEKEGRVAAVSEELPKAFVLCQEDGEDAVVYLTQLSAATLKGRLENNGFDS